MAKNLHISRLAISFLKTRPHKILSLLKYITKKCFFRIYRQIGIGAYPLVIMIRITHQCNLKCFFCGQHGIHGVYENGCENNVSRELTTPEWRSFIGSMKGKVPYLIFTGGEALLRKDLVELLQYASSCGIITHLNTNAITLVENARVLCEAGLDFISVSLDSNAILSKEITGDALTHQRVVEGMNALLSVRREKRSAYPIIQIFTTINSLNQNILYEIAEKAEKLGVDIFTLCFPIFTTNDLERKTSEIFQQAFGYEPHYWKGFIADMSDMNEKRVQEQIGKIREKKWNYVFKQIPSQIQGNMIREYFSNPEKPLESSKCSLPWMLTVILPNGDVATCWDHPDYITGNIQEDSIQHIWGGERYNQFRRVLEWQNVPSCGRCTGHFLR